MQLMVGRVFYFLQEGVGLTESFDHGATTLKKTNNHRNVDAGVAIKPLQGSTDAFELGDLAGLKW